MTDRPAIVLCPRCGHSPSRHTVWGSRNVVTCKECPPPKRAWGDWKQTERRCRISIRKIDSLAASGG